MEQWILVLSIFLGYDHKPEVNRATLHSAARAFSTSTDYRVTSWEDLRIGGRVIINEITTSIDSSGLALFDLSTLNPNVLFELGYAIASNRRVGILMEGGSTTAALAYKRFGLLRGIGYSPWTNTESVIGLIRSGEFDDAGPLGAALTESAGHFNGSSLLFLPALHQSEPDSRVRKLVQSAADQRIEVVTADPNETRLEALTWYASKVYSSGATLLHFEAPRRADHDMHNARLAMIGGMAHGWGRQLLMLAEDSYEVPLDYDDLLRHYTTPDEAQAITSEWLESLHLDPVETKRRPHLALAVELKSLRFGEHVAENEIHDLPNYFIETAEYRAVIDSYLTVFVGRKGTGKSANLYLAAAELRTNRRNLVVVVRPAAYDFEGLVDAITRYSDLIRSHAINGIWKLLLMSEIARTIAEELAGRESFVPLTNDEQAFLDGIASGPIDVTVDFGSRIDLAVDSLRDLEIEDDGRSDTRELLNETLHSEWIGRLRHLMTPLITSYDRVAILIDNLDKGWERSADLEALSDVLLGLLTSIGKVEREVTRDLGRRSDLRVTLAVFIRSDIFGYVKERAREPDKIVTSVVQWDDPSVLRRVVEERFSATRRDGTNSAELWEKFFCPTVNGISTPDFLITAVLPRPRDLIYLCNAAVGVAINRRHSRVEEEDILSARAGYSQFALEALLVENGITVAEFETVLLEFLGSQPVLERDEVFELIKNVGFEGMRAEQVFQRLKAVSFLGIETSEGVFEFPEIGRPTEKAEILARKRARSEGATRFTVHSAYRPFLEIPDN